VNWDSETAFLKCVGVFVVDGESGWEVYLSNITR